MKTVNFKISGMHCKSCAKLNESSFLETKGVKTAKVDILTESAQVEFDEGLVSEDRLKEIVKENGYQA